MRAVNGTAMMRTNPACVDSEPLDGHLRGLIAAAASILFASIAIGCSSSAEQAAAALAAAPRPSVPADDTGFTAAEAAAAERASIERVQGYLAQGDPQAALAEYRAAAARQPEAASTQILLARLHLLAGDADGAKQQLLAVLSDPSQLEAADLAEAHYVLALVAAGRGDYATQRVELRNAVEANPRHSDALASLAAHHAREGDADEATELFDRALRQQPDNVAALLGRGSLASASDHPDRALGYYDRASDADPEYAFVYVDRAGVFRKQRRYIEAIADMTRAVALEPDFYWHYLDRGRLHVLAGDRAAAVADFTRAIDIDAEVFAAYAYRGSIAFQDLQPQQALADYERAAELRPDYYPAYPFVGLLNGVVGRWMRAAEYFERSAEHDERELGYLLLAGLSYRFAGHAVDATEPLLQVRSVASRNSWYYDASRLLLGELDTLTLHSKYRDHLDKTQVARLTFYLGAVELLAGHTATAELYFLEAQDRTEADYLERYLAQSLADDSGATRG